MNFLNFGKLFSSLLISSTVAGLTIALGNNYARGNPDSVLQNYVGTWITFSHSRGEQEEFAYANIRLERNDERLIGLLGFSTLFGGILEIIPSREDGHKLEGNLYIVGFTDNVIEIPVNVELTDNNQNLKLLLLMTQVDRNSLPQEFIENFDEEITAENITLLSRRLTNNDILELSGQRIEMETQKNIGSMNRAQQAYFLEHNRFTLNISELGVGIPSENENFSYQINSLGDRGVQIIAIPKQNHLNSYTGGVFVPDNGGENRHLSVTILCESEQPSTNPPSPPQFIDQKPQCPGGFREVTH